jgi:hypothetical protein
VLVPIKDQNLNPVLKFKQKNKSITVFSAFELTVK